MPKHDRSPFRPRHDSLVPAALVVAVLATGLWYLYESKPPVRHQQPPTTIETRQIAPREDRPAPMPPSAPVARFAPRADDPQAAWTSIYLCRSYQGATFWASTHCQEHQALIERIHRVSTSLTWPQQVAIAQGEARAAQTLYAPPSGQVAAAGIHGARPHSSGRVARSIDCEAIADEIQAIDAATRQPLSGQQQDRYRVRRQALMARAQQMRC